MQGMYYKPRRRHRHGKGKLAVLLLLCTLFLVSCVAGSNALWLKGLFGLDLMDYRAERVEATHAVDSSLSASLCDTLELLTVGSTELTTVKKSGDFVKRYRDELLNHLLEEGYSRYTGDMDAIREAELAYPNLTLSVLIPAEDLEALAMRHFGLQSVSHGDGELFTYLEKIDCYTFSMKSWEKSVRVIPESIEETYHTYRMVFCLEESGSRSESYQAIFVKRSDGSAYLRALEKV
ncbi:MAG: hypothetical protein E7629_05740 [Ruminococcaceae bacterium]|nr:hypothetical protein [Oscillospiraceae bacterium]